VPEHVRIGHHDQPQRQVPGCETDGKVWSDAGRFAGREGNDRRSLVHATRTPAAGFLTRMRRLAAELHVGLVT